MIIRITVNNNDYKEYLERAVIWLKDFMLSNTPNDTIEKFNKLTNPNISKKLTETDEKFIIDIILEQLKCSFKLQVGESDYDYLIKHLDVSLVDCYEDKWENGEVIYYFYRNDKYLIN